MNSDTLYSCIFLLFFNIYILFFFFFFSSRRRHTRYWRDWSSDVCSSDLERHVNGLRTIGREHRVFGRCRLDPYFDVLQIAQIMDLALAVDIPETHRPERQGMGAFDL